MDCTIVVADDHPLFRKGLVDVLQAEAGFTVVAESGDGEAALTAVRHHRPRVAVLDIEMPRASGLVVAEAIQSEQLPVAVVVLTMHTDRTLFQRALDLGVMGYLLKDTAVHDIAPCVHMVASERAYICPGMSQFLLPRQTLPEDDWQHRLTGAEHRVLRLVASKMTTRAIAEALGVSAKTVENHRAHIARKLQLRGHHALLRFALEHKAMLS